MMYLIEDAITAHNRYQRRRGLVATQPNLGSSSVETIKGEMYVRLANVDGLLGVYGVAEGGRIRRLKSFPMILCD